MPELYLIDKAKLLFDIWDDLAFLEGAPVSARDAAKYLDDLVRKQPTIEPEVRHGRWLSYTGTHYTGKENEYGDPEYKEHIFFVCSNCRRKTVVREHFCPNCGTDMREEGVDNG